jgi:hypothetical protein
MASARSPCIAELSEWIHCAGATDLAAARKAIEEVCAPFDALHTMACVVALTAFVTSPRLSADAALDSSPKMIWRGWPSSDCHRPFPSSKNWLGHSNMISDVLAFRA